MLTTGMLGGLSTFSTFSMETIRMIQHGHEINALGNIILNISLSLFGVILGMALGRDIAKNLSEMNKAAHPRGPFIQSQQHRLVLTHRLHILNQILRPVFSRTYPFRTP